MTKYNFTTNDLINAVKISTSYRNVLKLLNLDINGNNNNNIRKLINEHKIDVSHFKGHGWSKNMSIGYKKDINDYLNNKIKITSYKLKNRLFEENLKQKRCEFCLNTKWLDNNIPLELDHIDGNKYNNNLSNLRILCPNCHALTPTYKSKNRGKYD